METDAARANPQRGYHLLKDIRLAAAETAPEPPGEISPAASPPLTGARAKVKVEPCFILHYKAPLEKDHFLQGCFLFP